MEQIKDDKQLLVEKYHLKHENNAWYSERENSHKHLIFKDVKRSSKKGISLMKSRGDRGNMGEKKERKEKIQFYSF